ncbi:MAG: hypothetical protein KDK71_08465 [Chlamydiia bacterium]|nr:hypothetical protein [Chlamydiia bacterium]
MMMEILAVFLFTSFGMLPSEFYLDQHAPIDQQEECTVVERLPSGLLEPEQKIAFDALPSEVKEIIRLESGQRYLNATFVHWVTLGDHPATPGQSVKVHIYTPLEYDEALQCDVLADQSWRFSRQSGMLKLR